MLIPDYLGITNISTNPTFMQQLRMSYSFFTTWHLNSSIIRHSGTLKREEITLELIEMCISGGSITYNRQNNNWSTFLLEDYENRKAMERLYKG